MSNPYLILELLLAVTRDQTLIPMSRDGVFVPNTFYPEENTNVTVHLAGIGTIQSFVTTQNRFGKGLRDKNVRKFYKIHQLEASDSIVIEQLGEWEYSIYPYRAR